MSGTTSTPKFKRALPAPAQQPARVFCPPKIGDVITWNGKHYYLGKFLGNGAFGNVYECSDEWNNELVAKVLVPHDEAYEVVRERWRKELNNLVELRHPNITYVHDAFECQHTFYLIIERCHMNLEQIIASQDFQGGKWLLPIARCVLQAIHFIHSNNYVHKDIHPGNIFAGFIRDEVDPQIEPALVFKVGDLGISRLEPEIDALNTILARWMLPPEFLNPSEFGRVCRQIDIYHAGLCMLSLLLGRIPTFTEEEILAGVPRQLAEQHTHPAAQAVARSLRRHAEYRTQTALEFWNDILLCYQQASG